MTRPVLIFGNGLGMAYDPHQFALGAGLRAAWDDGQLTDDDRGRIAACLGHPGPPEGEHELFDLQRAVHACGFLADLQGDDELWLTAHGRKFPASTHRFITLASEHFQRIDVELDEDFHADLDAYIRDQRPHVATLNYDWILYRRFVAEEICSGYNGHLVDGLVNAGFRAENLDARFGRDFGLYMHLHGSSRIVTSNDGRIRRLDVNAAAFADEDPRHVVLTHFEHKVRLIAESPILSEYWMRLREALHRTDLVVLIGYSGADAHLNRLLQRAIGGRDDVRVIVVEWAGSGAEADRRRFWDTELTARRIQHRSLDSILGFRFSDM